MTLLINHPGHSHSSDAACLWGVTLVDPQVTTGRRIRDEDAMLTVCCQQPEWAAWFFAGVLSHVVRTLPTEDPWRCLSARLESDDFQGDLVRQGSSPVPVATGAVMPDGRAFGGHDHPRSVFSDPEMDTDFAALSDGLTRDSAALFAFATDGVQAAYRALTVIRLNGLTETMFAPGTSSAVVISRLAGESVWTAAQAAIRWAVHRRRLLYAAQSDTNNAAGFTAAHGREEVPRDIVWMWASFADQLHSGARTIAEVASQAKHEIDAEQLRTPLYWPED